MKKQPEQAAFKQAAPEVAVKAAPTHITVATFTGGPSPNYNISANSHFNGNAHFHAISNYTTNSSFNTSAAFLGMSAFSSMQPQRSEPSFACNAELFKGQLLRSFFTCKQPVLDRSQGVHHEALALCALNGRDRIVER